MKLHYGISLSLLLFLFAGGACVAAAAEPPVCLMNSAGLPPGAENLVDLSADGQFAPAEAWARGVGQDEGLAEWSVQAGLRVGKRQSWYTARLPVLKEVRGPGAFRFGGWMRIDDGTDYYRDHLAMIQLVSSGGFSAGLWSYRQTGEWVFFERRVFVP